MGNREINVSRLYKKRNSYDTDKEKRYDEKLRQLDRSRRMNQAFSAGFSWFKEGKDLQLAIDNPELVNIYGEDVFKSFIRGYESGIRDYGRTLGNSGTRIDELPEGYASNKYFLEGYKNGLLEYQKKEAINSKHR